MLFISLWRIGDLSDGTKHISHPFTLKCHSLRLEAFAIGRQLSLSVPCHDPSIGGMLRPFFAINDITVQWCDLHTPYILPAPSTMMSWSRPVLLGFVFDDSLGSRPDPNTVIQVHLQRQMDSEPVKNLGTRVYPYHSKDDYWPRILPLGWHAKPFSKPDFQAGPMFIGHAFRKAWEHVRRAEQGFDQPLSTKPDMIIRFGSTHDGSAISRGRRVMFAHKLILAGSSDALADFVTEGASKNAEEISTSMDVAPSHADGFYAMLRYLYTGSLQMPNDDVATTFRILKKYLPNHPAILDWCLAMYQESITMENLWSRIQEDWPIETLQRVLQRYIKLYGDCLLEHDGFTKDLEQAMVSRNNGSSSSNVVYDILQALLNP